MPCRLILQIFYEIIFFICLFIIHYPQDLPDNYFDDIVFTYKAMTVLLANIGDKKHDNRKKDSKLNISYLKRYTLEKLSKKQNRPIILMNPFASSKHENIFKELHIGKVKKNKN